jgi:holo-[acyl-carrier protein] synthase
MKAMRCRHQGVRWTDIEIVNSGEGPAIVLGGAAAIWAEQIGIEKLHVSLGACRTHATAYVMATDEIE